MASWMQVALDLRRLRTECTLSVPSHCRSCVYRSGDAHALGCAQITISKRQ